MTITQTNENGKVTIKPEGWLDTASSPELNAVVESITQADAIVFDFDLVEYMSSAGLRAVVAAHKKALSLGAAFSVVRVCNEVMSIFQMTGIDKKLTIEGK